MCEVHFFESSHRAYSAVEGWRVGKTLQEVTKEEKYRVEKRRRRIKKKRRRKKRKKVRVKRCVKSKVWLAFGLYHTKLTHTEFVV